MPEYLELSADASARVQRVVNTEAPVATLQSSVELHYAASAWSWDNGLEALREVATRPDCSLATALLIYWNGEAADFFFGCADAKTADEKYFSGAGETFELLRELEDLVVQGFYSPHGIGYDPGDDGGTDLRKGWDDPEMAHPIPPAMVQVTPGPRRNPEIFF